MMKIRRNTLIRLLIPLLIFFCTCLLLDFIFPFPTHRLTPDPSLMILDRNGRTLRVFLNPDDNYYFPVTLNDVSEFTVKSFITFEDRWFYWHPGFNPFSIARAAWMNLKAGRILSGGSTITQQVARLTHPRPRTITAKIIETFRAVQLELRYSKDEILEFYLNLAPYGGNIQGIEAAAEIYFGKSCSEIGPGEAALLTALPGAPSRLRPDRNLERARKRRREVLNRMLNEGLIDEAKYMRAFKEDIPGRRNSFDLHAPHFCDYIFANIPKIPVSHVNRYPGEAATAEKHGVSGFRVISTIDLDIQEACTRLIERHIEKLETKGIYNAAVVVLDNGSHAVRALIGSAGYFSITDSGQVNGAVAVRSPGSALKPFAYGLGFDRGIISPFSLIEDVPIDYHGYAPVNYDETYHGIVTAEDALKRSLNVPAVNLVAALGLGEFFNLLKNGGLAALTQSCDYYGLQLVLGGAGVRLLELTNLYSALANGGRFHAAKMLEDQPVSGGEQLLSAASCYILTEILSELNRPDFPANLQKSIHLPRVAWKTGTSYGHRDAWSIGYNPRFTVGVWVGNFSGKGVSGLVGADVAGPLLFDIFSTLERGGGEWFDIPDEIAFRDVCLLSGMPPNEHCPGTRREICIANRSPANACNMHINLQIDDETGGSLCPHCITGRSFHNEVHVKWQANVLGWMIENGNAPEAIPPHYAACRMISTGEAPVIKSPLEGVEYILREGIPLTDQQIIFEASVSGDVQAVFWFLDGTLVWKGQPGEKHFYSPRRGRHLIVCMDDAGRKTRQFLVIR